MKLSDAARDHKLVTVELIPDRLVPKDLALLNGRVDGITIPALRNGHGDPSYPTNFHVTPQQRSIASALIVHRTGMESVPSLTCRDFRRTDLSTIPSLLRLGLENLLVLFGDPQPDSHVRKYHFSQTKNLIRDILSVCESKKPCIGVVTNQYSPDHEREISRTLDKVDVGGDFVVTNVSFDEQRVLGHLDDLRSRGLNVPVLVQVSIPSSLENLQFVGHKFGIPVPENVKRLMSGGYPGAGIALAARTFEKVRKDADGVHFSYLLRSRNPIPYYHRLLENLGIQTVLPPVQVETTTNPGRSLA